MLDKPGGTVGSYQSGLETRCGQPCAGQVEEAGVHFDGEHPLITERIGAPRMTTR